MPRITELTVGQRILLRSLLRPDVTETVTVSREARKMRPPIAEGTWAVHVKVDGDPEEYLHMEHESVDIELAAAIPQAHWAVRRANGAFEPYVSETSAYCRSMEMPCETVTILKRHDKTGEWHDLEVLHAWCDDRPDYDHAACKLELCPEQEPRKWVLMYDGGHGIDTHTFDTAADAIKALAVEAREGWQRVRDLGRPDLPSDAPADDHEAIRIFHQSLAQMYALDLEGAAEEEAHQRAQEARGDLAYAPEELDCYRCAIGVGVKRTVVKKNPVNHRHADPTQTYTLSCGHVAS